MDRYDRITEHAGLHTQYDRTRVAGYRSVKAAEELKKRTEYGTIKTYSEMLKERTIVVKDDNIRHLPMRGNPDSISDLLDKSNDKVLTRRVYDYRGIASVDFDTTDHGKPKYHPTGAHKHTLDHTKKNPHVGYEKLTDRDLAYNADIIQKGVNYFDET